MNSTDNNSNFLMSIGFMISYRCNIACPHCIVQAGPKRTERMSIETGKKLISDLSEYENGTVKCIALTGGEPFFEIDIMRALSAHAQSHGMAVSCVTNAFWATSIDTAREMLLSLPGLKMVSLSTDLHHQKFIHLDNIRNATEALKQLNMVYNVAVCHENGNDPEFITMMNNLKTIIPEHLIKFSRTLPFGRMKSHADTLGYTLSDKPSEGSCTMASFPVIFPQGLISACIGPVITLQPPHPLILGDLRTESITSILNKAQTNPILQAIRIWGPSKIFEWLNRIDFRKSTGNRFITNSLCDACYKLTTDPEYTEGLILLSGNQEFIEEVAYGRAYFLHEEQMALALDPA